MGSIFLKNLDTPSKHAFSRAFSFLFFPFFFSLLKMKLRSVASKYLMAYYMKTFRIKTHRLNQNYSEPHFFILNKGLNSGKPLNQPCPNCFVCITANETDKDFMYWLCFGLWKSKSFHFYLKGSVIPFITIGDMKKHLRDSECIASNHPQLFHQSIHNLKLLKVNEEKLKILLKMIETAKKAIFYKLMNKTGAV